MCFLLKTTNQEGISLNKPRTPFIHWTTWLITINKKILSISQAQVTNLLLEAFLATLNLKRHSHENSRFLYEWFKILNDLLQKEKEILIYGSVLFTSNFKWLGNVSILVCKQNLNVWLTYELCNLHSWVLLLRQR